MAAPSGYSSLGLIGFTDKGAYNSNANYMKNDLCDYGTKKWCSKTDNNQGHTPAVGTYWRVFIDTDVLEGEIDEIKQTLSDETKTRAQLGAHNLDIALEEIFVNTTCTVSNNGYRVVATSSTTWANYKRFYKLNKNTDYVLRCNVATTAGTPRIAVYGNNTLTDVGGTAIKIKTISADGLVEVPFNSGNYEYVFITFFVSVDTAAQGDVLYSNFLLKMAVDSSNEFIEPCETNQQLTKSKVNWDSNAELGAHNLIEYPWPTIDKFPRGITFTDDGDGSITLNGTNDNTEPSEFYISRRDGLTGNHIYLDAGTYILKCKNMPSSTYIAVGHTKNGSYERIAQVEPGIDSSTFTLSARESLQILIGVAKGATINATLYPFITIESDNSMVWTPYAMTNQQLTQNKVDITAIGTNEDGATANNAYNLGDYFYRNGRLCYSLATTISVGDALVDGSNYGRTTVARLLKDIFLSANIEANQSKSLTLYDGKMYLMFAAHPYTNVNGAYLITTINNTTVVAPLHTASELTITSSGVTLTVASTKAVWIKLVNLGFYLGNVFN